MTRKSVARIERDIKEKEAEKALENNTCWDDLNAVHAEAVVLMSKHSLVAGFLRNKELNAFLPDSQSVVRNGKILAKDVAQLAEDLAGLAKLHEGKTGGTQDPDVLMHSIAIFEQYQLFMSRHEAVIMPTVGSILEQYHAAEERFNVAVQAGHEVVAEAEAAAAEEAAVAEGEFVEVDQAQPAALKEVQ